jgi:hypothetical protein
MTGPADHATLEGHDYVDQEPDTASHRYAEGYGATREMLEDSIEDRERLTDGEIEELYSAARSVFIERYGTSPDLDHEAVEMRNRIEGAGDTVSIGRRHSFTHLDLWAETIAMAMKNCYDEVLEEAVDDRQEVIDRRYAFTDAEPRYRTATFSDIDNNASFNRSSREILVDTSNMDRVGPGGGIEDSLIATIDHELTHALQYDHSDGFYTLAGHVDAVTDDHAGYRDHPDRAAIETAPVFEAYVTAGSGDGIGFAQDVLEDEPLKIEIPLGLRASYGDVLIGNPYDHARMASAVIDTAFRQEYGEEEGRELAREAMLTATTADGIEGMLQSGLAMLDVPDYVGAASSFHEGLVAREDREEAIQATVEEIEEAGDLDDAQRYIYLHALEDAARDLGHGGVDDVHDLRRQLEPGMD